MNNKGEITNDRIILGIDPGTTIMGYGLIHIKGRQVNLLHYGVLYLHKYNDAFKKLQLIFEKVQSLIDTYHPDELSIEAPFYGKNVQSMLKLGRAQGVAIAAAVSKSVPAFEYSPKKIKQSITGSGNASKEQVAFMLKNQFNIKDLPKELDATDGLAAAVCHYNQGNLISGQKKYSGWGAFIKENPDRKG